MIRTKIKSIFCFCLKKSHISLVKTAAYENWCKYIFAKKSKLHCFTNFQNSSYSLARANLTPFTFQATSANVRTASTASTATWRSTPAGSRPAQTAARASTSDRPITDVLVQPDFPEKIARRTSTTAPTILAKMPAPASTSSTTTSAIAMQVRHVIQSLINFQLRSLTWWFISQTCKGWSRNKCNFLSIMTINHRALIRFATDVRCKSSLYCQD